MVEDDSGMPAKKHVRLETGRTGSGRVALDSLSPPLKTGRTEGRSGGRTDGRKIADAAPVDDSPRYRQILKTLTERVAQGVYPVGSHVPTESELCEEFDVSRYTVRAALSHLVEHGMVTRRKGIGTVVIAAHSQRAYQQSISSLADLFQFALDTYVLIRSSTMVELTEDIARTLGAEPGERWLQVDSVRWTAPGGTPICCTSSFIPERLAWVGPELPDCVGPFYAHIEERSKEPLTHATQEIRGERMPAHLLDVFGADDDAIALCLIRQYFSVQGVQIASFNWHPADSFSYKMQIERKR
jgi:DNA-binding GntR family transcriptional regulator